MQEGKWNSDDDASGSYIFHSFSREFHVVNNKMLTDINVNWEVLHQKEGTF